MGVIQETNEYTGEIYSLETTDPVLGGEGGIANRQAKQLANRTKFLRALWGTLAGVVVPFAGLTAPEGFLLCDGRAVSRTDYADLFAVVGVSYNTGGEAGTVFRLPDLRGRAVAGMDNIGGTAAGRLTTAAGGVNATTIGATGGASTHTLTIAQIPVHNHGVTDPGHNHAITDPGHTHGVSDPGHTHPVNGSTTTSGSNIRLNIYSASNATNTPIAGAATAAATGISIVGAYTGISVVSKVTGITTNNNGSGGAHAIVQPTIALNYIIKF